MKPTALLLLVLFLPGALRQEKTAPPDVAAERQARAEIRTLFEKDYEARDEAGYRALARKLCEQGKLTRSDPVARYVLLSEAREYAVRVLDLDTAVEAIRELSVSHAIDAAKLRKDLVAAARTRARTVEQAKGLAEFCLRLAGDLAESEGYAEAADVALKAEGFAKRGRDPVLAGRAGARAAEFKAIEEAREAFKQAELALSVNPEDPKANLDAGVFLCFVRGDWERGLKFLALGSDEKLRDCARRERAEPKTVGDRIEVATGWYALSRATRDETAKARYSARARFWYEQARSEAQGVDRARIDLKLKELGPSQEGAPVDLLALIDPTADVVEGKWRRGDEGIVSDWTTGARIRIPYEPPEEYDFHVVFTRLKGRGGVTLILSHAGRSFYFDMGGWRNTVFGFGDIGGKSSNANPTTVRKGLESETKYDVRIQVRKDSLKAFVDNQRIIDWKADYESLAINSFWNLKNPDVLGLGCGRCPTRFERVELLPVSGRGRRLR